MPVRANVAMTGEITLRGRVLPIGGLKEKMIAAHRGGIRTLLIPKENEKDLSEIPAEIRRGLEIHLVDHMDQVLARALALPDPSAFLRDGDYEVDGLHEVPPQIPQRPVLETPAGVN